MWGATISCIICLFNIGISIHAPRVGSDDFWSFLLSSDLVFQSTLPVWGATAVNVIHAAGGRFQSTLPVWGATHFGGHHFPVLLISIHAPRVGSDALGQRGKVVPGGISIHAPRVGSDGVWKPVFQLGYISIHAPRVGSDDGSRL